MASTELRRGRTVPLRRTQKRSSARRTYRYLQRTRAPWPRIHLFTVWPGQVAGGDPSSLDQATAGRSRSTRSAGRAACHQHIPTRAVGPALDPGRSAPRHVGPPGLVPASGEATPSAARARCPCPDGSRRYFSVTCRRAVRRRHRRSGRAAPARVGLVGTARLRAGDRCRDATGTRGTTPGPGAPRRVPGPARQCAGSARAAPGRPPVQPATMPEVKVSSAA